MHRNTPSPEFPDLDDSRSPQRIPSQELSEPLNSVIFPGCYYEIDRLIKKGGMGKVYATLLRDQTSHEVVELYACKIVTEDFVNRENR